MKANRYKWVIDAVCLLFMFLNMGITNTTFNTYLPYINALPSMSDTLGSLVVSCRMGTACVCTFFAAKYFAKFDCRVGISLACLCTALSCFLFSLSNSFVMLCVSACLAGVSYAFGTVMGMTLIIGRWFNHNKATAIGIGSMGTGVAAIIMPSVITTVAETSDFHQAFFIEAIIALVVCAVVFLLLRNYPPETVGEELPAQNGEKMGAAENATKDAAKDAAKAASKAASKADGKKSAAQCDGKDAAKPKPEYKKPLTKKHFRMLQVAALLQGASNLGMISFLAVLLKTNNFDSYFVAGLLSMSGVCLLVAKFFAGIVYDKLGSNKANTLYFALFFCGVCTVCTAPLGIGFLAGLGIFLTFMGQPVGSIGVSVWAFDFSTEETRADVIKGLQVFFTAGTLVCSLFPGILYDLCGTYVISYVIFALFTLASSVLVLCVYKKNTSKGEAAK